MTSRLVWIKIWIKPAKRASSFAGKCFFEPERGTGQRLRLRLQKNVARFQKKIWTSARVPTRKRMRRLEPVTEPRHQLGGIQPRAIYKRVKGGALSLVKIGRRSLVHAEDLDDFISDMQGA